MTGMRDMRGKARAKSVSDAERRMDEPRPLQRVDSGLFAVLAGVIALAAGGSYAAASWIAASGRLDPPLVTQVEDPRILADYRANPSGMRDMVAVADDLLIGRQDGTIDRFDMAGRTFAAESLPRNDQFSGDLQLLSTDCPADGCKAGAGAYAVTAAGGLAERRDGTWHVLLGDGAFRAVDGTPVEQGDVTGWAASQNGRLVLVNAGAKGIGLFDQRSGVWRSRAGIAGADHGPLFHDGAFWLGAADGVHRLNVAARGFAGTASLVPGTEGEILDLAFSATDGLLALRRGNCAGGASGCLSLLKLTGAGQVQTLLAEIQSHPNLNDSGLRHVVRQGEDLVTLGTAGVHRYSASARYWTAINPQEPTAHFAGPDGARLHVGLPDRFVTIAGGEVTVTTALDAPLKQILPGNGTEVFGLDTRGRVLALGGATPLVLAEADGGVPPGASFAQAAAVGSLFVAMGPQGVLVHDTQARRYSFTPANALPPMSVSDALLVPGGAGRLWIVARGSGQVQSLDIAGDFPAKQLTVQDHGSAQMPIVQAHANADGLDLIAGDGTLLRLNATGQIAPMVGPGLAESLRPVSMAAAGSAYFFAGQDRVWLYDEGDRAWRGPDPAPQDGDGLTDIAVAGDRLVALDRNGTVYRRAPEGWQQVYGGPLRAQFGGAAVQDAFASGQTLFMASDHTVQAYVPDQRSFGDSWTVAGQDAEILGVTGNIPLWTNSGGVYLGQQPIFDGREFIDGWMGASGPVAMGDRGGRRYVSAGQSCLYMGVAAPRGEIRDVVPLTEGRLLVRTATEAGIYEPGLHRWLRVTGLGTGADSRLMNLNGHLVRLDPAGLASLPIGAVAQVASCATDDVPIDWQVNLSGAQATRVDGAPQVLVLMADGSLRRWADGQVTQTAPTTGEAPSMAGPHKVYAAGNGGIRFLGPDALWHYDLSDRTWRKQAFTGAPRDVQQFDLVETGTGPLISLWDGRGDFWRGQPTPAGDIAFDRVTRPVLPAIPIAPAQIRDMAGFGDRIAVLSDRRLMIFDAGQENARADIALPAPQQAWQLASDASGDLILVDGPADDPLAAPVAIHRLEESVARTADLSGVAAGYAPGDDRDYVYARDGRDVELFRIDRDLNAWRCRPVRGQAAPDCELLAATPMQIAADDIRGYDDAARVLLTGDALWRLDDALRVRDRINGPAVGADSVLLNKGSALLLWEKPGGALWRIKDGTADRILPSVDFLREVDDGHAALVGDEVKGIRDGQVVALQRDDGLADDPVARAHFTARGHVTLSKGGVAVAERGRLRSDPLIGFSPDAVAVLPVPNGADGHQRWLQATRDGQLSLIWADLCEVPVPPPAPLPPEFIGPPAPVVPQPPVIEPCVTTRALSLRLEPGEHVMDVGGGSSGSFVIQTNRREIAANVDGAVATTSPVTTPRNNQAGPEMLRGKIAMIDGTPYLNPPAIGPNDLTGLAADIGISRLVPTALDAFDNGWIAWRRDGNRIRMSGADQPIDMDPTDALRDGRFLPAHPARGAALADGGVAWVNAFGLWHQSGPSMRRISPAGMAMPQALDQGAFLDRAQGIAASDGAVGPGLALRVLRVDALEFTVDPLRRQVAATITVAGRAVQALAPRGFLHDQRQSVAQAGNQAVYLTPVGLIPQSQLGGAQATPAGTQRLEAEGGRILARTPAGWMAQDAAGQWQGSRAPFLDERLAEENGRIWDRANGAVALRSADPGQDWHLSRQGLDFDIDQLVSFAATPRAAVAVTRRGTHAAPAIDGLRGTLAPVGAGPGAGELDTLRVAPGQHVLFHKDAAGYLVWDVSASRWRAPLPNERPWETRDLASVGGVSAAFRGAVGFEVAVEVVGQGAATRPFSWDAGEVMPFDHATAIHGDTQDGALLVGTRMGLRRVTPAADGYANQQLVVLPGASGGAAVGAVGRPAAMPDRIVVAYAAGCAQLASAAATPVACGDASVLSERFVAQTDYWRWTKSDAAVRGEYLLADGTRLPLQQPFRGRLPHDSLADSLSCANLQARLWRDAAILRVAGRQHPIPGVQGLFCQPAEAQLSGGTKLAAGLYVQTVAGVLRVDGAALTAVGTVEAQAIADRIAGRVVIETGRLRYGIAQGALAADRLTLAREWRPTPWQAGRLVLDQPRALAWHGRGLQMVTDAGVVDAPKGRLEPARLVAMQGPDEDALATCAADRVEMVDGRSHGLAAAPGDPLRLYCADGTWLAGVADSRKDLGALAPTAAAGSQRVLIDAPPLWKAVQDIDAGGNVRSIGITFRDEPARLAAGRFDFDAFRAIAAPFDGRTELLSDTGWWRAPAGVPLLASTQRPQPGQVPPRDVLGLTADRSGRSTATGLCLALSGGKSLWWNGRAAVEAAAACREMRGNDPLWSWWDIDGQPQAETRSTSGALLERRITTGRFEDLDVRGAPLGDPQGRLLVPGGMGVLVLDPEMAQPVAIHAGPGDVLLARAADGGVVQLDGDGAQYLGDEPAAVPPEALTCPALSALAETVPKGYRLTRADLLPGGRASAMALGPDGGRQVLLQCDDASPGRAWTAAVDISAHPRALAVAPGRAATLAVSLTKNGVKLDDGGKQAVIGAPLSGARAILPRPGDSEIFVIDGDGLMSVSVSAAIGLLDRQGKAPAPAPVDPRPAPAVPVDPATRQPAPLATPKRSGVPLASAGSGQAAPVTPPTPDMPADPARRPDPLATPNRTAVPPPSAGSAQAEPPYDGTAVQRALADALGIEMTIDGAIGPDTRRAIADWQRRLGSTPTGYLSRAQLDRLLAKEV